MACRWFVILVSVVHSLAHGQVERAPQDAPPSSALLCGRVLDEGGRPLVGTKVWVELEVTVDVPSGVGSGGWSFQLETDASGKFSFEWEPEWSGGIHRELVLTQVVEEEPHRGGYAPEVLVELRQDPPPGRFDLGDLLLLAPNSPTRWTRFEDEALAAEWARWSELDRRAGNHRRECEGLLGEMARRGGARWSAYLERLQAEFAAKAEEDWEARCLLLPTFRALRRAQGRPDPLQLELLGPGRLECTFPALPALTYLLHNVDPTESLQLVQGGSYRSGRFARLRFDLRKADGTSMPPLPNEVGIGGGMSAIEPLAPQEAWADEVEMARYVEPLPPGEYRFRLQYHDQEDIDELLDVRHWMVVESEEVVLVVLPRRVRLTRAEHASFARDLRAIDVTKPVLFTSATWQPEMKFTGPADTPEERLFRAGWQALPALLEALADPSLDDAHADWAMALCFDLTGLNPPDWINRVFARFRWEARWPTSDAPEVRHFGEWTESADSAPVEAERQAYRQRWLETRRGLSVEFAD